MLPIALQPVIRLEQPLPFLLAYPATRIPNLHYHLTSHFPRLYRNHPPIGGELGGIAHKIEHNLTQPSLISPELRKIYRQIQIQRLSVARGTRSHLAPRQVEQFVYPVIQIRSAPVDIPSQTQQRLILEFCDQ